MFDLVSHHVQGHVVGQRRHDGYVNATELCKRAGRQWSHFWENKSSKEVADEIAAVLGIPRTGLIDVVQGGTPHLQGTWVHPELAVHVAYWAGGPKWRARVGRIVIDWMQGLPRHQTYEPLLLPSPAEHQKRFQQEIFEELARIYGHVPAPGAKNWPQWMGAILKRDFYGRLNPDLPELPDELDNRNPVLESGHRGHKHHQDLTEDMGLLMLAESMGQFTMLLKMSKSPPDFRRNLFLYMPKKGDQGEFDLGC